MRRLFARLTFNQRLGVAALVLGALAVAADPTHGSRVAIDARELASLAERDADLVPARDLADWLVKARPDLRLLDVRRAEAFAAYHIPGAEHLPMARLADATLPRTDTIVVYGDDGVRAAQAWLLLRARGFRAVYMLKDGLEGWQRDVLFPTLAENPTPFEAQRNARLEHLARHFGGRPRSGEADPPQTSVIPLPAPSVPSPVAGPVPSGAGARKKREGC